MERWNEQYCMSMGWWWTTAVFGTAVTIVPCVLMAIRWIRDVYKPQYLSYLLIYCMITCVIRAFASVADFPEQGSPVYLDFNPLHNMRYAFYLGNISLLVDRMIHVCNNETGFGGKKYWIGMGITLNVICCFMFVSGIFYDGSCYGLGKNIEAAGNVMFAVSAYILIPPACLLLGHGIYIVYSKRKRYKKLTADSTSKSKHVWTVLCMALVSNAITVFLGAAAASVLSTGLLGRGVGVRAATGLAIITDAVMSFVLDMVVYMRLRKRAKAKANRSSTHKSNQKSGSMLRNSTQLTKLPKTHPSNITLPSSTGGESILEDVRITDDLEQVQELSVIGRDSD